MKKYKLLLLLTGTAVMIAVMTITGSALKTPATPKGILDLEFAYNKAKTDTVITAWAPTTAASSGKIEAAKLNTKLDFIFLFFYSLFLFYTCKKIAGITNSKIGSLIAKGALWAGFLDIFENAGMLVTLSRNSSDTIALCTTIISIIKWALAITAVIYLLVGLIQLLLTKKINLLLT